MFLALISNWRGSAEMFFYLSSNREISVFYHFMKDMDYSDLICFQKSGTRRISKWLQKYKNRLTRMDTFCLGTRISLFLKITPYPKIDDANL